MSKTPRNLPKDRRTRPDLDLFIIALVERNLRTPYDLLTSASLSPGATLPVLTRLERAGYLRRGKPGARRRTEFQVTLAGRQWLNAGWTPLMESPGACDIEATLRIAMLSVLSGAKPATVATFLKRIAAAKAADAKVKRAAEKKLKPASRDEAGPSLYRWMLAVHSAARLASEAKTLRQLAIELARHS